MSHKIWVPSVAVCLVLVVGACGNDELSRAQAIERGDAACAKAADEIDPLFAKLFPTGTETPSARKAAPTMTKAAEVLREESDTFVSMRSVEDEEAFGKIRSGVRRVAEGVERSAKLARAGDTDGYLQAFQKVNELDADVRELMRAYGFEVCAGEA